MKNNHLNKYFLDFEYKNLKKGKIDSNNITSKNYENIFLYNYTIKELNNIINSNKIYNCRLTKKTEIRNYCINMLYLNNKVFKIQKVWKKYFIKLFNKTLGPSFYKRSLSNNTEDFLTAETVEEIDYYNYFSFKHNDNFIYTFNIVSIYTLLQKKDYKNPYNRIIIENEIIEKINKRIKYNKILNKLDIFEEYSPKPLTEKDKIINIFYMIDSLGNYSSSSWFTNLNKNLIIRFIYELYEIWNYRAGLSANRKMEICPPNGNPFIGIPTSFFLEYTSQNNNNFWSLGYLRNKSIIIMEKLIYSAQIESDKNIGALYVLSALTLVSTEARDSLPWLYASVYYN